MAMCKVFINSNHKYRLLLLAAFLLAPSGIAADKINVRGDTAAYSADGSKAEFSGNVVITAGDAEVRADKLVVEVEKDANLYRASGTPVRGLCISCASYPLHFSAPKIVLNEATRIMNASGGVVFCAGAVEECAQGKLQAQHVEWRRDDARVMLQGEPVTGFWVLNTGARADFRAGTIEYDSKTGDIILQGDARLARNKSEITGESIVINVKTGALSAQGGGDDGRVQGVFGGDE